MNIDPSTTKYLIKASIVADGIVEKPDVVGAIFGQTEGLLGNELDLRDMQKSGRIGRIEVEIGHNKGKSEGEIMIPSSLDQVETVILAAALVVANDGCSSGCVVHGSGKHLDTALICSIPFLLRKEQIRLDQTAAGIVLVGCSVALLQRLFQDLCGIACA